MSGGLLNDGINVGFVPAGEVDRTGEGDNDPEGTGTPPQGPATATEGTEGTEGTQTTQTAGSELQSDEDRDGVTSDAASEPAQTNEVVHTAGEVVQDPADVDGEAEADADVETEQASQDEQPEPFTYDPAEHTIPDIHGYLVEHPEHLGDVIAAEEAGRKRKTLLAALHEQRDAGTTNSDAEGAGNEPAGAGAGAATDKEN